MSSNSSYKPNLSLRVLDIVKEARKWVQKNWPISHSTKAQTTVLEHRLDTVPNMSFKSDIPIGVCTNQDE